MIKECLTNMRGRGLGALVAVLGLGLVPAASAQAGVISTNLCDSATLTQPFAAWGDSSFYKLAPGGDFASGASSWSLSGGASVVGGGEPFAVAGVTGSSSLYLPAGSSAQSSTTCVDAAYPTMRMFYKGSANSILQVAVVYVNPAGIPTAIPVGTLKPGSTWAPTPVLTTMSAIPSALTSGVTQMAIRFTAITGSAQVDGVLVDPRMRY